MAEHESSVNFRNLIRDLAEMYPHTVPEVVLVELIANSLDAGATRISIQLDLLSNTLVVTDDGKGMASDEFAEYHDFAAGLKRRGDGIGFAGVGAKISFNVADKVITETRSDSFSGGSNWYLQSDKQLIWDDYTPKQLHGTGTRVEIVFRPEVELPYQSTEELVKVLQRHYFPLMDTEFLDLYGRMGIYSNALRFVVNGLQIAPSRFAEQFGLEQVREFEPKVRNKATGYGILGISPAEYPLTEDYCGVLLCTRGKIVKPDFFNQFPGTLGPRILGLVDVPALVEFLTTSKTGFTRQLDPRKFERYYAPIRDEFKAWMGGLGIDSAEVIGTDEAALLEREMRKIIDEVPELSEFFGFRARKKVLEEKTEGPTTADEVEGVDLTFPEGSGSRGHGDGPLDVGDEPGTTLIENENGRKQATPISRKARRGPKVQLENVPDRMDLAWADGNMVIINTGHPAYRRVSSNKVATRQHCLFAIANAIQRFKAGDDVDIDIEFIDRMMAALGKK